MEKTLIIKIITYSFLKLEDVDKMIKRNVNRKTQWDLVMRLA